MQSAFTTPAVTVANDGDGGPDWWMLQFFGHPTGQAGDQSLASGNPVGDGLSNLQKYLLGLNPLAPARKTDFFPDRVPRIQRILRFIPFRKIRRSR